MRTVNCLKSWDLRSFILFRYYGAKWDYSCKVLVALMFWGERKNERLELVKNLGSENKQNVTTIRLVFLSRWPIGLQNISLLDRQSLHASNCSFVIVNDRN